MTVDTTAWTLADWQAAYRRGGHAFAHRADYTAGQEDIFCRHVSSYKIVYFIFWKK